MSLATPAFVTEQRVWHLGIEFGVRKRHRRWCCCEPDRVGWNLVRIAGTGGLILQRLEDADWRVWRTTGRCFPSAGWPGARGFRYAPSGSGPIPACCPGGTDRERPAAV